MEDKLYRYLSKTANDKIRLTELIAHFTHNVSGNDKESLIFNKILPSLLRMEKENKIKLSWDVMLSRYRFPRYIYCKPAALPEEKPTDSAAIPLWQKQIEDILKKEAASVHRKSKEQKLQDKFDQFSHKYETASEEIKPSEEWTKIITAFMESNLSQYDVMRACIEAFKAGVIWERYRDEFK